MAANNTQTGARKTARKRSSRQKAKLVQRMIDQIESRLDSEQLKPTVADLIRLVQLEKELEAEEERPKEIKVTWVEPKSASGE